MPSQTLDVKFGGELHRRILQGVRDRVEASKSALGRRHDKWKKDEEVALAYLPERSVDAARRAERDSGKPQYTTIQIPYSYAVLMSMHTYWTTVFMSRSPVNQFTGRHGESQQQVQALEALIDYQVNVGHMLPVFYIWLMDVGKYGLGVIGSFWDEEFVNVSELESREELLFGLIKTGRVKKVKITRRIPGYEGNKIFNIRPFDFFPDPRVPITRFQEGEFCANYIELSYNTILKREELGYYTNVEHLMAPGAGQVEGGTTGNREEGSSQLELPSPINYFFDGNKDARSSKKAEVVPGYECVIDLVPRDWGLGSSSMPEKWVFTVTSDYTVVLGAQPHGANHGKFPFQVLNLETEGYALYGRGMPEILAPVQNTIDWLINSHFYNVRKTINNQVLIDPSRVNMQDAIDSAPGGFIRLRPSAYGQDVRTMFQQVQMVDITRGHMADISTMLELGQRTSGVNDQIMGMLQSGGRKTAAEVRTSSTFGINRLKTQAEYFSATGWAPLAQMMVQNSQQYYEAAKKLRIVGDLAGQAGAQFVDVTPEAITGFYDFVPVDGTLPIDRFAQANLWRELFAQLRTMPEILMQYDMGKIFEWVAQLAGLKNVTQFRVEVIPPAQMGVLQQQVQRGNVVPMPGRSPAGPQQTGVPQPRQVPGMGTTG